MPQALGRCSTVLPMSSSAWVRDFNPVDLDIVVCPDPRHDAVPAGFVGFQKKAQTLWQRSARYVHLSITSNYFLQLLPACLVPFHPKLSVWNADVLHRFQQYLGATETQFYGSLNSGVIQQITGG